MGGSRRAVVGDRSTDPSPPPPSSWRLPVGTAGDAVRILILAAVYYVAAKLSLRLALVGRNVTPLWPPTGIAVVAFLLFGRRVWPGVALAAFLVNLPISANPLAAAATAAGNTLAPLAAAELLNLVGFHLGIDRLRDAVAIVLLAALGAMTISATIGTGTLVLAGSIPSGEFPSAWAVWWTGDAMGVLVVAPFLLSLLLFFQRSKTTWSRRIEAALLFVGLAAITVVVARTRISLLYLLVPLLGWAAWRFQQRGAAPAALIVTGIATWAAAHGTGPFPRGTLFEEMLSLQAFNATVAFTSFFFAALVTERLRDRETLQALASELEDRVRTRTSQLSAANDRLELEIAERKDAERRLRYREGQLAEAQQVARVGSWEWLIPEDRVEWSDEMYRIHGYTPQEFPVTFERAVELVVPQDLERIRSRVSQALAKGRNHDIPGSEYRIIRPDGEERVLRGKSRLTFGRDGEPVRMVGTVQDITEDKRAEREHRIAEILQRSLLPDTMPTIPGLMLAARYVPAAAEVEVGGDWYDVVPLADGRVAVAIGDVAGHGLRAASTMGQLRMALRAYALEEWSPGAVLTRLHRLVQALALPEMATAILLLFDLETGTLTFANAGHPPPLLIPETGEPLFLEGGLAPPLGAAPHHEVFPESTAELPRGATLLLYTDGLVERRGTSLRDGLARLKAQANIRGVDPDAVCSHLLSSLVESDVDDDIALLVLRPVPLAGQALHLRVPARPDSLAPVRHAVRRWLTEMEVPATRTQEVLVACGEACANAVQHPYGATEGTMELDLALLDGVVEVTVRDFGRWRPPTGTEGGRGLYLMQGFMDSVDVERLPHGTVVRMRRSLEADVTA